MRDYVIRRIVYTIPTAVLVGVIIFVIMRLIPGDAGIKRGDALYDGTSDGGGKIDSLGVDAVPGKITDLEADWLERKLAMFGLSAPDGVRNLQKIVAGKKLWNYDNLEPTEKKIVL